MKNLILTIAMFIVAMPVFASQNSELECLATNIYYESKSESFAGKIAIAQITLNRVNSKKFPDSVCSVVYERTRTKSQSFCQFSWTCRKPSGKVNQHQYQESLAAAAAALQGEVHAHLRNALYFQEKSRPIPRGRKLIGVIGNHAFLL